jgi:hypothetical protein
MRLPRFKLQTLVILVTLATLAVGGAEYWRRAARYRALAAREATMESADRAAAKAIRADLADWPRRMREAMEIGSFPGPPSLGDDDIKAAESSADRHGRRRQAYRRCARYPWLTPPADDPDR